MKLPAPAYTITITRGPAAGRPRVMRAIRYAVSLALAAVACAVLAAAGHGRLTLPAACIAVTVAVLTVGVRDGSGKGAP